MTSRVARVLLLPLAGLLSATGAIALRAQPAAAVHRSAAAEVTRVSTPEVAAHEVAAPVAVHLQPTRRPAPVATQTVRTVTPPARRTGPAPVVTRSAARTITSGQTPEQLMWQAIRRLPVYNPGDATWTITPGLSNWGRAELHGAIYISPTVPANRMYDVVAHEWSHVLSVKAYDGDDQMALAAFNAYFGGTGFAGAEKAADCMARLMGATWTHYTPCTDPHWQAGARRLLQRLPLDLGA